MKYSVITIKDNKKIVRKYEASSTQGLKKLIKIAADLGGYVVDETGAMYSTENVMPEATPEAKVQILIDAINAEWQAIRQYESMKQNFSAEEQEEFDHIIEEEKIHVGQFQAIMDKYSSTTQAVIDGQNESKSESTEDKDDMPVPEAEAGIVNADREAKETNPKKARTFSEWVDAGESGYYESFAEAVEMFPSIKSLRNATAQEIWDNADRFYDVYPVDSDDRELAFNFATEELGKDYDEIYNKWLGRDASALKQARMDRKSSSDKQNAVVTQDGSSKKDSANAANQKSKVRASIQEMIDDEIITEEEARSAYALGLADALKDDVALDLNEEIEVDDVTDHDQVEQAIYDLGTADAELIDEDEDDEEDYDEFDDDIDFDVADEDDEEDYDEYED